MSRIGKKAILLPEGVKAELLGDNVVKVIGPLGEIQYQFDPKMEIAVSDKEIRVSRHNDTIPEKSLHGTTRALLNNMVVGVSKGFQKNLVIEGVGYKMLLQGNTLTVSAGYSHPFDFPVPEGLKITNPSPTEITVSGVDKQLVGEFAAEVRNLRRPEPYTGKGIRYKNEIIRRKEGKRAK